MTRGDPASLKFVRRAIVSLMMVVGFSGCHLGYIARSTIDGAQILLSRRSIDEVLQETTDVATRDKLSFVLRAREHAQSMGLVVNDSFTTYAEAPRTPLTWVLTASHRAAFKPYTWWFPIVGTVPYKGFQTREQACSEGEDLMQDGYEISVRGADAYSTLGWFNDPILSTTLARTVPELVLTVIHESVHQTVWVQGSVEYNESLAQYIGLKGMVEALASTPYRDEAEALYARARTFARYIERLYNELDALYKSNLSEDEKLKQRNTVRNEVRQALNLPPEDRDVNNATIVQEAIYYRHFESFDEQLAEAQGNWRAFLERIEAP